MRSRGSAPALAPGGGREVVAEGVPVEVEREARERLVARVPPVEDERAGDRALLRDRAAPRSCSWRCAATPRAAAAGRARPSRRAAAAAAGTCAGPLACAPSQGERHGGERGEQEACGSGAHRGPRGPAVSGCAGFYTTRRRGRACAVRDPVGACQRAGRRAAQKSDASAVWPCTVTATEATATVRVARRSVSRTL